MLGKRIETRTSRFRSILWSLILLLHLTVCLRAFAPTNTFSSSLAFRGYTPLEAYLPLRKRTRGPCIPFLQAKRIDPSPSSALFLDMASNNGNDEGNRSHKQCQKDKDPRRREATTNAAPMYITIGKHLHLLLQQ